MDEGIDTGPILLQRDCPIGPGETAGDVEGRLSEMGAALLVATLEEAATGRLRPQAQKIDRATYAPKIRPEMAWIPWTKDPVFVTNLVRAMNPRPGAITSIGASRLKVWRAAVGSSRSGDEKRSAPGTVLPGERVPRVACGEAGSVILQEMQMEGRRRVTGEEAIRGRWLSPGERLGEATGVGGETAGPSTPGV
jgi:methionyl-tRNA formyltransferase